MDDVQRDNWWLVGAGGLAAFMGLLDISIGYVALPTIEHSLGASTSTAQWVVLGYLLPLVALAYRAVAGWTGWTPELHLFPTFTGAQ